MAERYVRIEHRDGRELLVQPKDFDRAFKSEVKGEEPKSYADQGFRVTTWEDGTDYEGPKSRREIDAAKEERAAARAAKQDARDETPEKAVLPKAEPKKD